MPFHARRPTEAVLAELLLGVGAGLRIVRVARRVTQRQLTEASGVSQSAISLIERGRLRDVTLAALVALAEPLEVGVDLQLDGPLLRSARRRDVVHARCAAAVVDVLVANGWLVREEVPIGEGRVIGFIDILAFHPEARILLVIEVKSRLDDLGDLYRQLAWYEREALGVAETEGWDVRERTGAAAFLASDENARMAIVHASSLARRFPADASAAERSLRRPEPRIAPFLLYVDPAPPPGHPSTLFSRPQLGLAPYADHAEAVRHLLAPPRDE